MVITYYGASCFKIQSGDVVLAVDPPSKKSGFKPPRFQADVVFISHDSPNHNGVDCLSGREKDSLPFTISGPGEYEFKKIPAIGIRTFHDPVSGKKFGVNTSYVFEFEGTSICHLGDFGEKELRPEVQEILGEVDILFVPLGGAVTEISQAIKIVNQIEPKIIIPMHYFTKDNKIDKKILNEFLKELGQEKAAPMDKFTFKQKDIAEKEGEVVVLNPSLN